MGVTNHWTGLLDWNTGLDYWTHIFLVFTHSEVITCYVFANQRALVSVLKPGWVTQVSVETGSRLLTQ